MSQIQIEVFFTNKMVYRGTHANKAILYLQLSVSSRPVPDSVHSVTSAPVFSRVRMQRLLCSVLGGIPICDILEILLLSVSVTVLRVGLTF